jgi:hypothetical protein
MNTLQVGAESPWLVHAAAATILYVHIAGGSVGIVSGATVLALRKGGRAHVMAGNIFFISMMAMTSIGALVAPFLVSPQGDPKLSDSLVGFFTFYLVTTGWMTVRRKPGTVGRAEVAAFLFAASLAAAAILLGTKAANSPDGIAGGSSAAGYFVLGGLVALAAAFDAKVILNRGIIGVPRIARHLWRMCLALFVAVGSFFLGQQRVMPEFIQGSLWLAVPPLAVLAMMLFWLVRVRLGRRLRRAFEALGQRPRALLFGVGDPDRGLVKNAAE